MFNLLVTYAALNANNFYLLSLTGTKLYTGTQSLLTAIGAVITGLILGTTTVTGAYTLWKRQGASDQETAGLNKKFKTIVVSGIVATCFSGVVTAVLAFYK